jgi:hypothetical protein
MFFTGMSLTAAGLVVDSFVILCSERDLVQLQMNLGILTWEISDRLGVRFP